MNSPCSVISPRPARPRGDPFLSYQNTGNLRLRSMSFCGVQANLAETLWGNKSLLLPPLKVCTLPQSKTKEYLVPALKLNDIKPQLITLQNCWMLHLCSALASSVWGVGKGSTKQRGVVRKLEALVIPILARGMCLYLIFKSLSIKARGFQKKQEGLLEGVCTFLFKPCFVSNHRATPSVSEFCNPAPEV